MLTFEDFTRIVEEEVDLLPSYVHDKLDGGVLADSNVFLHPKRVADDLYILGTYSVDPIFGNQIVLYYGSFISTIGDASEEVYRDRIRDTVRHEFLHHMETRAGEKGLVEEDAQRMRAYFQRHGSN